MKNTLKTLLAASVLAVSLTLTQAADTKIATVDMKKLFNGYYKTKLAQSSLENRKTELRKEIKEMGDKMENDQAAYKKLLDQANDPAISADEREKRKQATTDKAKDINNTRSNIDQFQRQAEAQLADQSQRMSMNLVNEIQKAVSDKAKAGGYTIVLNAASAETVVYAGPDNDLTTNVLTQLNAGAPVDLPTPSETILPMNIRSNAP